jgi:hypothetical protein
MFKFSQEEHMERVRNIPNPLPPTLAPNRICTKWPAGNQTKREVTAREHCTAQILRGTVRCLKCRSLRMSENTREERYKL